MKITIKTLQGKQLPLEVEDSDTVSKYLYSCFSHCTYLIIYRYNKWKRR